MNHPRRLLPASPSRASARRRKLFSALAALLVSSIALVGCAAATDEGSRGSDDPTGFQDLLATYDLAGLDARQVIERLDAMPVEDRPADLLASVQPDALVIRGESGQESRLPMPQDEVYISVAPFRDQTHECHFHSLTTCVGELADAEVRVVLTADDGEVLIDETRRTYDNGFTGLWVPRGLEATLTVESEELSGTVPLSTTSPDDPTCITTLQLL